MQSIAHLLFLVGIASGHDLAPPPHPAAERGTCPSAIRDANWRARASLPIAPPGAPVAKAVGVLIPGADLLSFRQILGSWGVHPRLARGLARPALVTTGITGYALVEVGFDGDGGILVNERLDGTPRFPARISDVVSRVGACFAADVARERTAFEAEMERLRRTVLRDRSPTHVEEKRLVYPTWENGRLRVYVYGSTFASRPIPPRPGVTDDTRHFPPGYGIWEAAVFDIDPDGTLRAVRRSALEPFP